MSIESQKQLANEILNKLFPVDPNAILAGGAPRDWYYSNEATDLDIFFHVSQDYKPRLSDVFEYIFNGLEIKLSYECQDVDESELQHNLYARNENISKIFNIAGLETKVQLILMKKSTFQVVVPRFPLSICKAWYKPTTGIRTETIFNIAGAYKSIIKTDKAYANGDKFIKKILNKFPDYEYFDDINKFILEKNIHIPTYRFSHVTFPDHPELSVYANHMDSLIRIYQ